MIVKDFNVYDDNGNFIETIPAIVIGGRYVNVSINDDGEPLYNTDITIKAIVPNGTNNVTFVNSDTNEIIATVIPENNIASITIDYRKLGKTVIRVGEKTLSKLNETEVIGYE